MQKSIGTFKGERESSAAVITFLDGDARESAVVVLSELLMRQIHEFHHTFALTRSSDADLRAVDLVRTRQVW